MSDDLAEHRCTSASCVHGPARGAHLWFEAPLGDLPDRGCGFCGCKRLEMRNATRGHFIVDWRSQKSLRKHGVHRGARGRSSVAIATRRGESKIKRYKRLKRRGEI
jgi:hypothetical protein